MDDEDDDDDDDDDETETTALAITLINAWRKVDQLLILTYTQTIGMMLMMMVLTQRMMMMSIYGSYWSIGRVEEKQTNMGLIPMAIFLVGLWYVHGDYMLLMITTMT